MDITKKEALGSDEGESDEEEEEQKDGDKTDDFRSVSITLVLKKKLEFSTFHIEL